MPFFAKVAVLLDFFLASRIVKASIEESCPHFSPNKLSHAA